MKNNINENKFDMNSDNSNNLNYSSSDEESNFFLKSHQNKNQSNNFNNNENNINNYNIENLKNSPSKNSTLNNDISEIKDNKKEENQIETNSNSFLGKKQKHPKKKTKNHNTNNSKQICQFYIHGACKKGDSCPFNHNAIQIKNKELCKFFLSGNCMKGEKCLYSHNLKEIPCKFFHGRGFCEQLNNCLFSHERLMNKEEINNFIKTNENFLIETKKIFGRTNLDDFFEEYLKNNKIKENNNNEIKMIPESIENEENENNINKQNNRNKIPLGIEMLLKNNKTVEKVKNFFNTIPNPQSPIPNPQSPIPNPHYYRI